jgi:hypothetical protein
MTSAAAKLIKLVQPMLGRIFNGMKNALQAIERSGTSAAAGATRPFSWQSENKIRA